MIITLNPVPNLLRAAIYGNEQKMRTMFGNARFLLWLETQRMKDAYDLWADREAQK